MPPAMTLDRSIAFIGAGNMAGALIRGLLNTKTIAPERIIASDVDAARLQALASELGIRTTTDNAAATRDADVVVLATKPQVLGQVLPGVAGALKPDALLVSIAAGVSAALIERKTPAGTRVVRTMPNTPALVGAGATALAAGTHASEADLDLAETLFRSVGVCVRLPEAQIDAVTGLSGSGPAYVFATIEALRDAGVREGLDEGLALTLASQTVFGAARLLLEQGESPETLRERVTSPGGTTRAGLDALEAADFAEVIAGAVRAATRRSVELREIAEHEAD
jgi:pyrroline-5-carboxylate reductase